MAGLQSGDDRLSHLGTIHQRDRHTDSHVATANAAPSQSALGGKNCP